LRDSLWIEQSDLTTNILGSYIAKEIWNESKEIGSQACIFRLVRKQFRQSIIRREFLCLQIDPLQRA
jgi:hypothetical protein